jgi:hypothetical protein
MSSHIEVRSALLARCQRHWAKGVLARAKTALPMALP